MTDRPNLKQIRIKKSVCERLDDRKGSDDSYTDVVKALLEENERLTARCEELQQDKENLMTIAILTRKELLESNDELFIRRNDDLKRTINIIDELLSVERSKVNLVATSSPEVILKEAQTTVDRMKSNEWQIKNLKKEINEIKENNEE